MSQTPRSGARGHRVAFGRDQTAAKAVRAMPGDDPRPAGCYYEELDPGRVFQHRPARTVTETDNLLVTTLTHNTQPLHLDAEFAREGLHGRIVVNSIFTLGLLVGLSVADTTSGTTVGNLGFEEVRFPHPVFVGDTLSAATRVTDRRPSASRPGHGIVWFEHEARNQAGTLVVTCRRAALVRMAPEEQTR